MDGEIIEEINKKSKEPTEQDNSTPENIPSSEQAPKEGIQTSQQPQKENQKGHSDGEIQGEEPMEGEGEQSGNLEESKREINKEGTGKEHTRTSEGIFPKKETIAKLSPGPLNSEAKETKIIGMSIESDNSKHGMLLDDSQTKEKSKRRLLKAKKGSDSERRPSRLFKNSSESIEDSELSSVRHSNSKEDLKGVSKEPESNFVPFLERRNERKMLKMTGKDSKPRDLNEMQEETKISGASSSVRGLSLENFVKTRSLRKFVGEDSNALLGVGQPPKKTHHQKDRFFTVAQDILLADTIGELRGYSMATMIQNALRRDPMLGVDHTFESIRDRIKRKLKRISPEDMAFMREWANGNPGRTGYVHFRSHEKDSKYIEIELISEEKPNGIFKNNKMATSFGNESITKNKKEKLSKKKKNRFEEDKKFRKKTKNILGSEDLESGEDIDSSLEDFQTNQNRKSKALGTSAMKSNRLKALVKESPPDSNHEIIHQTGRIIPTRATKKFIGKEMSQKLKRPKPEDGFTEKFQRKSTKSTNSHFPFDSLIFFFLW